MTRRMADSIYSVNIPVGVFPLVAGYVNGPLSQWSATDWARHAGHSILVRITVFASRTGRDVHMLDVEKGDATPEQAPGWVKTQRALGAADTVYCSEALWPAVRAAFTAQGVAQPPYVVAAYPGEHDATGNPLIPAGAIGHQWIDRGPYDESVVADYWPGVDPGGPVTAPNSPDDDLVLATLYGSNRQAGPDGVLRNVFDNFNVINGTLGLVMKAISGLTAEDTAILTATQGVDADVKAGIAQLAATIKTGVDVPTLAAALAAVLVPLLPPDVTPAQIGAAVEAAIAAQFAK